MKSKLIALGLTILSAGCSAQSFYINGAYAEIPTSQSAQHFFVAGIGQEQTTDAAEICGGADKIIKVEAQQTFVNGLLALLTWGIYAPRDAKVYCRS